MAYPIARHIVFRIAKLWIREVHGIENVPNNGPFIIAANHSSYFDHFCLGHVVIYKKNRYLHFLAKKEHFDTAFQRLWHRYSRAIPVDRESGGEDALKQAISRLKGNAVIGIYPEGTRSLTGKIQKAKTGVARLALGAKVPVVPVGLIGTFNILPKGRNIPKMKRAIVNIGRPISFDKYYGRKTTKRLLREVTKCIMKEIAKLCGQKYRFRN
ncbi:1-acyl-sn-glycerol-3-phosphate acyltransferase [Candidatus Woesearchaeota archaeon]|nr:1-acyl-sn-glycerol-3-phosphate acyltransferase [Candidatus Woesearchaeota archaeon]